MISIIVPIYKVENFIRQCIDSIVAQTYKDLEIILVDDGSPDNCPKICDEYAKADKRVRVIHQPNGGLINARKSGLKAASGDYVCFVDGDDWIEPDMYEHIAESIESNTPDCIITQFYYSYTDKEIKSSYALNKPYYNRNAIENEVFPSMLFTEPYYSFGIYPNCWTKVFKKVILEKHLMDVNERIRLGEDIAFTFPCLMECQSISFIDKALYHYRINSESMTKKYDPKLCDIFYLPYETLMIKSEYLNVDLSDQLPYYLLYLVNFLIRNETLVSHYNSQEQTVKVIERVINNNDIQNTLARVDPSIIPSHTKILLKAINRKNKFTIRIYMKLLRKFMK